MIRTRLLPLVLSVLGYALAAPTTYDLRQDGDLNVKVDLENFVIVVARPTTSFDIFGSMSQLLADSRGARNPAGATGNEPAEAKPAKEERHVEKSTRSLEEVVASLRSLRDGAEAKGPGKNRLDVDSEERKRVKLTEGAENVEPVPSDPEPQSLKLVGDGLENCGPGRSRDSQGACQADPHDQE